MDHTGETVSNAAVHKVATEATESKPMTIPRCPGSKKLGIPSLTGYSWSQFSHTSLPWDIVVSSKKWCNCRNSCSSSRASPSGFVSISDVRPSYSRYEQISTYGQRQASEQKGVNVYTSDAVVLKASQSSRDMILRRNSG